MSSGSLDSEFVNDAAVPSKTSLQAGRHVASLFRLCRPPYRLAQRGNSAHRLNDTVIDGNCPWWLMESASVVFSKCRESAQWYRIAHGGTGWRPQTSCSIIDVRGVVGESAFAAEEGKRVFADESVLGRTSERISTPAEDDPEDRE